MKRNILKFMVIVLALIMIIPIIFIVAGSFMSPDELKEYLAPILGNKSGFINWPLLPQYPTLKSLVKLLLDSPEFFVMFWNSVFLVVAILLGQVLIATPAAWAFAQYRFPCKKVLFTLYFIKNQNKWPLSLYLPNISLENADMAFVASLVTLVTSLIVFFAGQKYLKEGISAKS